MDLTSNWYCEVSKVKTERSKLEAFNVRNVSDVVRLHFWKLDALLFYLTLLYNAITGELATDGI